ncbi:MAG TPA: basic secretory protein-like protein [Opitutus sp.]|nr:basic secretory protein-like protein [Opitutus sp.]
MIPSKPLLFAACALAVLSFAAPRPARAADVPAASPDIAIVRTSDDYCQITIDTVAAPELSEWAKKTLAPVLASYYPKIVAMLPSDGYNAPKSFTVSILPTEGVAYTVGTHVVVNADWLNQELDREAVGAIVHECVHVVQQYGHVRGGRPAPGWIVEGMADYIRFFKYEPQLHGADATWLQAHKARLNYDGMYRISANFLDYVATTYDPSGTLIQKLNAACRKGVYTDDFWQQNTGKTLADLNTEWKAARSGQPAASPSPAASPDAPATPVKQATQ